MKEFFTRPKTILWGITIILLLVFIFQNVEPTSVKFLFWSIPAIPKLVLILLSMLMGTAITLLIVWDIISKKK